MDGIFFLKAEVRNIDNTGQFFPDIILETHMRLELLHHLLEQFQDEEAA